MRVQRPISIPVETELLGVVASVSIHLRIIHHALQLARARLTPAAFASALVIDVLNSPRRGSKL